MPAPPKDTNWTIPNLLTVVRLFLTPCFVIAFVDGRVVTALVLFMAAGVTDALDGFLARVLRQRSRLGAILDPLADKVLLVTSFVCLCLAGWLPKWLTVLVVSRDALIVGGLTLLNLFGADVKSRIRPSWISKFTTLSQICLVGVVLVARGLDWNAQGLATALVWLTAALTTASGLHYVLMGFRLFPAAEETGGD